MQSIVPILRKNGKPPVPAGGALPGAGASAGRRRGLKGRSPPAPAFGEPDGRFSPSLRDLPSGCGQAAACGPCGVLRGGVGRPLFHPDVFHAVFQDENHPLVARAIGLNGEPVQLLQQFLRNAQRMRRLPSSPRRLMVRGFASLMSSIVSHSVSLRNNCSLPNPGKTYNIKLS